MTTIKRSLLGLAVVVLLLISLTANWLNGTIFNNDRFTAISSQVLAQESSRLSIGQALADRIFTDKPILKAVLSDRLAQFTAAILASQPAQNMLAEATQRAQLILTSPRQQPIIIDISPIKSTLANAPELQQRLEDRTQLTVDDLPDQIMLIDTSKLPNVHQASLVTLWLGPLSLALAILLLGWWIKRAAPINRPQRLQVSLMIVIAAAVIALLVGPLVKPLVISLGQTAPSQTLLRNFYQAFIEPFNHQALLLGGLAFTVLIIVSLYQTFIQHYTLSFSIKKKAR